MKCAGINAERMSYNKWAQHANDLILTNVLDLQKGSVQIDKQEMTFDSELVLKYLQNVKCK